MRVTFAPLLSLVVRHRYLDDAAPLCEFVLPADSLARLRAGRHLARATRDTLHVLFEANEQGAPIAALAGDTLRVGVRLVDSELALHTQPQAAGTLRVFDNAADAGTLASAGDIALTGSQLRYALQSADRPLALALEPAAGVMEAARVMRGEETEAVFDLASAPPGRKRVVESGAPPFARYFDPAFSASGCDRAVELRVAASHYQTPARLTLQYETVSDLLRYFVVVRRASNGALDQLEVKDPSGGLTFTRAKLPAMSPAEVAFSAPLGVPASELVLFRSTALVPHRAAPRKGVHLVRGNVKLVDDLPQPSAGRAGADFVIYVS
jgi:hypothetical protein